MPVLIDRLERATWLDDVADRLGPTAATVVGDGRRRDLLTGRWLGHAAHPAVVLVPVGCWVGSAVVDVLGGRAGRTVARRLVAAGVAAAAPAAATGLADWRDTSGAERRVATAHSLLNTSGVLAMAASWLLRRVGLRRAGLMCSTAGLAAVGAGGWLGGHLVYARGVGVSTTAFRSGPAEWTRLVRADGVAAGEPVAATIGSVSFIVVRAPSGWHVLENRCTHRGGPLADGELTEGCIVCPWHGSAFALGDGAVRRGPATIPQPVYETRVVDGWLEIRREETGGLRQNPVDARPDTS